MWTEEAGTYNAYSHLLQLPMLPNGLFLEWALLFAL